MPSFSFPSRRITTLLLVLVLTLIMVLGCGPLGSTTPSASVTPPAAGPRTVFVHLFEWKWTDITQECERFLGPKGFAGIQISPPEVHIVAADNPWWERYQPV